MTRCNPKGDVLWEREKKRQDEQFNQLKERIQEMSHG